VLNVNPLNASLALIVSPPHRSFCFFEFEPAPLTVIFVWLFKGRRTTASITFPTFSESQNDWVNCQSSALHASTLKFNSCAVVFSPQGIGSSREPGSTMISLETQDRKNVWQGAGESSSCPRRMFARMTSSIACTAARLRTLADLDSDACCEHADARGCAHVTVR
jgi:hypothetical protein